MTAPEGKARRRGAAAAPARQAQAALQFVQGLSREERMLVVLKRELYEGSWDEMVADLKARLDGRPYIFKLANRITDDLARIDRLRRFEQDNKLDLGQYVQMEA